jgi:hypothetical protein
MRALKQQLKWVLLRYEAVEPRIWADMARPYRYAETQKFTDATVRSLSRFKQQRHGQAGVSEGPDAGVVVPGEPASGGTGSGGAAGGAFSNLFMIEDKPVSGCTHWIDLAAPARPVRLVRDMPAAPTVRYHRRRRCGLRELEQLRAHIAYTRSLPEGSISTASMTTTPCSR